MVRWEALQWRSALATALVIALLLPGPTLARTIGISAGDTAVYSINSGYTYATPNGNVTKLVESQEQIAIRAVNVNATIGEVEYTATLIEYNGSAVTTNPATVTNFTTIFNPFDNLTYTGNIGFWPFIYTDLQPASEDDIAINFSVAGVPGDNGTFSYSALQLVDARLTRGGGLINVAVNFLDNSTDLTNTSSSIHFHMTYNSTTGLLENMTVEANVVSEIENMFNYQLVSYTPHPAPANYSFVFYIVVAAIVVFIVVQVVRDRRRSPKEKRDARMRGK